MLILYAEKGILNSSVLIFLSVYVDMMQQIPLIAVVFANNTNQLHLP